MTTKELIEKMDEHILFEELDAVEKQINQYPYLIHVMWPDGNYLLHKLMKVCAPIKYIKLILDLGANVCLRTAKGESTYDIARYNYGMLLERIERLGSKMSLVEQVHFLAETKENYNELKKLLENYKGLVHICHPNGRTLLQTAITGTRKDNDKIEIIKLILGMGADCNQLDSDGNTALTNYWTHENEHIKALLLTYGAKYSPNAEFQNFLTTAPENEVIEFLKKNPEKCYSLTTFLKGLSWDKPLLGRYLIDNNVDVNFCPPGLQPLIIRTINGYNNYNCDDWLSFISLLLKHGADLNLKDERGATALHYAVCDFLAADNTFKLIDMLLSYGAKINETTKRNGTPLDYALQYPSDKSIIKYLRDNGGLNVSLLSMP